MQKILLLTTLLCSTIVFRVQSQPWLYNGAKIYFNTSNVGIGTIDPQTLLSVLKNTNSGAYGTYPAIEINNPNITGNAYSVLLLRSGNAITGGLAGLVGALTSNATDNASQYIWLRSYASTYPIYVGFNQSDLSIYNGNIGVGTTDTKGYKFAVNGSAIFAKAVVKSYSAWPDYVFEKDYALMPLDSVENFVTVNKHLPNVPSATEVKKDGIDLGENQAKLLQKIEELTLYLIEQSKMIKEQNSKIELLQQEIENLKNK